MRALIAALMMCYSGVAGAQGFYSGNDLHGFCRAKDSYSQGVALGFALGVYDAVSFTLRQTTDERIQIMNFCPGGNVTAGQVLDLTCQYLANNPKSRNQNASSLVWLALNDAWPCD